MDNLVDVFCYVSAVGSDLPEHGIWSRDPVLTPGWLQVLVVWDMDSCTAATGLRLSWQWELGAFTLTLTWLNLLSLLR